MRQVRRDPGRGIHIILEVWGEERKMQEDGE